MSSLQTMNGVALSFSTKPKLTIITCRASTNMGMKGRKQPINLYKVLSLESEAVGQDEIRKAYRSMALRYHPDVCPPSRKEESTKMFVELQQAYETLSNPVLRMEHDCQLRMGEAAMPEGSAKRSKFDRGNWEAQLCELMRRSELRERGRRPGL